MRTVTRQIGDGHDDDIHRNGQDSGVDRERATVDDHPRSADGHPHRRRHRARSLEQNRPQGAARAGRGVQAHARTRDCAVQPRFAARVRHPLRHAGDGRGSRASSSSSSSSPAAPTRSAASGRSAPGASADATSGGASGCPAALCRSGGSGGDARTDLRTSRTCAGTARCSGSTADRPAAGGIGACCIQPGTPSGGGPSTARVTAAGAGESCIRVTGRSRTAPSVRP
jgi:hypothetical protein